MKKTVLISSLLLSGLMPAFAGTISAWDAPGYYGRSATVVGRAAWEWVAAEGPADLAGPDDRLGDLDADRVRVLLRQIFAAAGGTHDDWDTYDRVMAQERRTAVLVTPERVYPSA